MTCKRQEWTWNHWECYYGSLDKRYPTPVLLPGKSRGRKGLVGCSPWGRKESDMTERLHFIFSLSCIGEGNGNPLQCSCLENPRDGGTWWAAVYGVSQSWTRLKRLSSSRQKITVGTSLVVQWPRTTICTPSARGPLILGQGARFHMPQLRVCMPQLNNSLCRN